MNTSTIITAMTAATLTFALTACGSPAPTEPVDTPPTITTPAPTPEPTEETIEQEDAPVITDEDTVVEGDEGWDEFIEDAEGN